MPSQGPQEMVRCLECGELGLSDGAFAYYCTNGGEHGPTQTALVYPAQLVEPLVEALEETLSYIDDEERVIVVKGRATLANFQGARA